jgi:hypothetical protein
LTNDSSPVAVLAVVVALWDSGIVDALEGSATGGDFWGVSSVETITGGATSFEECAWEDSSTEIGVCDTSDDTGTDAGPDREGEKFICGFPIGVGGDTMTVGFFASFDEAVSGGGEITTDGRFNRGELLAARDVDIDMGLGSARIKTQRVKWKS